MSLGIVDTRTTLSLYLLKMFASGKRENGMKYTTETFKELINSKYQDIEILSEWVDTQTKIKCRCKKCKHKWEVYPRTIREKGCPKCNGSKTMKLTDEEYKQRLYEVHNGNIESLEPYVNMHTKILHRCNKHNYEWKALPHRIVDQKQGCKYCAREKIGNAKRSNIEDIKKKIFNMWENTFELLDTEYKAINKKMLFRHNMDDGSSHTFYATVDSILSGQGCGVCTGKQVCVGYNDIATTNPYVASLFKNEEETHLYTEWSSQKVDFKCPNCGHIRNKMISQVSRDNDICCPVCGDGYSYPNKFIYNCLYQIKDKFDFLEREYSPDWCKFDFHGKIKTGIYDIYFSLNHKKYIIEMDGGLGHGNRELRVSKEDSIFIDAEKDRLAIENGIKIIRIDCDYKKISRYDFIKANIYLSELTDIIDMDTIDFDKANVEAQSSLLVTACKLWESGYNANQICEAIHVVGSTVTNYLKTGKKYGLCESYSKEESTYRSHGRKIICIDTRKEFRSIVDGANYYNVQPGDISKCCRGESIGCGNYNGKKLHWMYLDEYNKLSDDEKLNWKPRNNNSFVKVVCLNNNYLFDKIDDAKNWCNAKTTSGIISCCTGKYKTSGKHPTTNDSLKWMYYKDYIKEFDESTLLSFDRLSA